MPTKAAANMAPIGLDENISPIVPSDIPFVIAYGGKKGYKSDIANEHKI